MVLIVRLSGCQAVGLRTLLISENGTWEMSVFFPVLVKPPSYQVPSLDAW